MALITSGVERKKSFQWKVLARRQVAGEEFILASPAHFVYWHRPKNVHRTLFLRAVRFTRPARPGGRQNSLFLTTFIQMMEHRINIRLVLKS